jgi:hypothetical protein
MCYNIHKVSDQFGVVAVMLYVCILEVASLNLDRFGLSDYPD